MLERMQRERRNLALLLILTLALFLAWSIRAALNPLLLGYLAAFVLHPVVARLERAGWSRRAAVNLTFVASFLLVGVVAFLMALQARAFVVELAQDPEVEARLREELLRLRGWVAKLLGPEAVPDPESIDLAALRAWLQERLLENREAAQAMGKQGLLAAGQTLRFLGALLGTLVLVPLYAYFLLFELARVHAFVQRYLPAAQRERITSAAAQIGEVIASFLRGRLGIALLKGALLALGFWIVGLRYPLFFGLMAGFLSIVPLLGPSVGFLLAFLAGLIDFGLLETTARVGTVVIVGEVVEGYLLVPKILGDSLGLHPMVVIFALLAGGSALGMFGVLIALPLTASLMIVARAFVLPALKKWADEDSARPPAAPAEP
jgi:predicted PurR-regulated permease PerM